MERSPADVGLLTGSVADWGSGDGVCVPFGGGDHDWAALEVGAWLASNLQIALRLVGARADARRSERDASRLLADAALAVQRVVGVDAEPQLIEPDPDSLVTAGQTATIVVTGLSPAWRRDGLGDARRALIRRRGARHCCYTAVRGRADSRRRAAAPASRGRSSAGRPRYKASRPQRRSSRTPRCSPPCPSPLPDTRHCVISSVIRRREHEVWADDPRPRACFAVVPGSEGCTASPYAFFISAIVEHGPIPAAVRKFLFHVVITSAANGVTRK